VNPLIIFKSIKEKIMTSKPVLFMSLVLMVLMTIGGVAYTQWVGQNTVDVTVTTGGVDVKWTLHAGPDFCDLDILPGGREATLEFDDVDPGTYTCQLQLSNDGNSNVTFTSIVSGGVSGEVVCHVLDPEDGHIDAGQDVELEFSYTVYDAAQQFGTYNCSVTVDSTQ
jgi:hypothetical protein